MSWIFLYADNRNWTSWGLYVTRQPDYDIKNIDLIP